jgi:hypothetical protein
LGRQRRETRRIKILIPSKAVEEDERHLQTKCDGSKDSKLRHSMPCIEIPEVAYLYGYLLVSAQVYTPDNEIMIASLCRHKKVIQEVPYKSRLLTCLFTFVLKVFNDAQYPVLVFPLHGLNLPSHMNTASMRDKMSAAKKMLMNLENFHEGGFLHRRKTALFVVFTNKHNLQI